MREVAVGSGVGIGVVYGWIALASYVYCNLAGMPDAFAFPWMQWTEAAPWWRLTWWNTVCVVVSAAFPTLMIICAGVLWWRYRHKLTRKPEGKDNPLYGNHRMANDTDLRDGGITSR